MTALLNRQAAYNTINITGGNNQNFLGDNAEGNKVSTNNINITGSNNQNIIGDNAKGSQIIHQEGAEFDLNKFFEMVRGAVPDGDKEAVQGT